MTRLLPINTPQQLCFTALPNLHLVHTIVEKWYSKDANLLPSTHTTLDTHSISEKGPFNRPIILAEIPRGVSWDSRVPRDNRWKIYFTLLFCIIQKHNYNTSSEMMSKIWFTLIHIICSSTDVTFTMSECTRLEMPSTILFCHGCHCSLATGKLFLYRAPNDIHFQLPKLNR